MKKFATCLVFLSTTAISAQPAFGSEFVVQLEANVAETCNLGSVSATAHAESTTINVSASCNAPRFEINLDGAGDLQILRASINLGDGQLLASDNHVAMTPSRPGGYVIEIEVDKSIAELNDLDLSITTS